MYTHMWPKRSYTGLVEHGRVSLHSFETDFKNRQQMVILLNKDNMASVFYMHL